MKGKTRSLGCAHNRHLERGITVIYSTGEIDSALDKRIIETLEVAGFRWWAAGYILETDERDLAFDLPLDL